MLYFFYFEDFSFELRRWSDTKSLIEHELSQLLYATEVLEFNCPWFFNCRLFLFFCLTTMTMRQSLLLRQGLTTWLKFSFLWYSHKTIWPQFLQTTRMTYEISSLKERNYFLTNLPLFTTMSSLITLSNDWICFPNILIFMQILSYMPLSLISRFSAKNYHKNLPYLIDVTF